MGLKKPTTRFIIIIVRVELIATLIILPAKPTYDQKVEKEAYVGRNFYTCGSAHR